MTPPRTPLAPPGGPAHCEPRRGVVWLVEDSPTQAEMMCRALAGEHDVVVFGDGASVLERAAAGPGPDVLVLDCELPGISGIDVLRFLRERFDETVLPTLMLTVRNTKAELAEGLGAGANDYLGKPFDPLELGARVRTLARIKLLNERAARNEQAVLEREAQLRLALEASNTGLWAWDLADDSVSWSPEVFPIVGLAEGAFGGTARAFFELVHPADRATVEATVRAAIEGGRRYECEFRLVRPGGEAIWVQNRGRAFHDAAGAPWRVLGTITDVTERRQAAEALARAQALTQAIIDGSEALIFAKSLDGRYFLTNRAWREAKGLPPEAAADGRAFGPALTSAEAEDDRRVLEAGAPMVVEETVDGRGRRSTFLSNKFPLFDAEGRAYAIAGVSTDVTELKQTQAALQASELDLRTMTDNSPDVLTRFDRDLRHVFVNAAVERATARPRAEFLGKTNRELGMPPPLCDQWEGALREVFATGEPRGLEFSFGGDDGTRHYAARLVPEFGPGGGVEYVLGVTHDVTGPKEAERALREADERKDEFLATLAHELRNPLAPLRSGLELLRASRGDPASAALAVGAMERQLGHLVRLVDDLLDVARISRGKVELKRERVDVGTVVDHAVEVSRPLLDAAGHALSVRLPAEPLWLDGDLTRLAQVVSNLLNNAAKYTPDGGHVELSARAEGGEVFVRVADDGAGISAEMLPRVFDLFAQVDRTLDRAQGGLGIGLSLVRKLVELHGGTIEARSDGPGRGSTFEVRLPRGRGPAAAPAEARPAAPGGPKHAGFRILVVDDNADGADLLAMTLDAWGHRTHVAYDGPGALDAVEAFGPQIIFLDIGLPGMDGYEVARRLRALPGRAGVALVALTGWGAESDRRRALDAGFDVHLTKPVDRAEIEGVLDRLSSAIAAGPSGAES